MLRFKRWTHGVVASIDGWIVQLENHEALAESALKELERGVARARVQLARVQTDAQSLVQSVAHEERAELDWRERARREANETRALECLQRSRRAQARVRALKDSQVEHERMLRQLSDDVRALEQRLVELRRQRNAMSLRQTRAQASAEARSSGDSALQAIGDIFERWESQLSETELTSGRIQPDSDSFEQEYLDAEETALLKLELAELKEERR
ncbi:MAG: PspA/IM30 family protein [Polyangiaceae bacterium]